MASAGNREDVFMFDGRQIDIRVHSGNQDVAGIRYVNLGVHRSRRGRNLRLRIALRALQRFVSDW